MLTLSRPGAGLGAQICHLLACDLEQVSVPVYKNGDKKKTDLVEVL